MVDSENSRGGGGGELSRGARGTVKSVLCAPPFFLGGGWGVGVPMVTYAGHQNAPPHAISFLTNSHEMSYLKRA